ncbi:DUF317 domain-containing protein [Streptomyces sp. NBC_01267]|uniref:DUF317 domain-containing protein n=1 Tax=Streptomyces sp. NBC_01267 TaxID=2903805 RepID=UPI002E2FC735|nr:DUF317 domain-containing protein [Streptomyces sp. NBC_01267]
MDVNVDDLPEPQVREVFAVNFPSTSPGFSTATDALKVHTWQLGPGQPTLVLDQFSAEDFHMVVDDRADVHVNSKDGRFYLGWFPLGRPGGDGEGWKIAVTGTTKVPGYSISFDAATPADIVAATVTCVLETAHPR